MPARFHNIASLAAGFPTRFMLTACLLLAFAQPGDAAFCSLRDPVSAIERLYPESNRYRSMVRPVNQSARDEISQRLPFTLHFNELGQHTLFLASTDNKPVGLVHARSELSEWGMIELAWALKLDMTIDGFYFQRCRSPRCNAVLSGRIADHFRGKSFTELLGLLEEGGNRLSHPMALEFSEDAALVLSIVRSALKTLAVTEISWAEDIASIRRDAIARSNLRGTNELELRRLNVTTRAEMLTFEGARYTESMIESDTVRVHLILEKGQEIGRLVEARWHQGELTGDLVWLFSPAGDVIDIQPARKWESKEIANAFGEVIGQRFSETRSCSSATEMAGKTLFHAGFRSRETNALP